MKPSEDLIAFLKGWESRGGIPDLVAYWDAMGSVWTIGFGETGRDVKEGTVWTADQAEARLRQRAGEFAEMASAAIRAPCAQNEFDAFVSILYNVGPGSIVRDGVIRLRNGAPSTLLRMINGADKEAAALQFTLWDMAGGKHIEGLHKRRVAEQRMYLMSDYWMRP